VAEEWLGVRWQQKPFKIVGKGESHTIVFEQRKFQWIEGENSRKAQENKAEESM
jgi:hypothetical protein